VDDVLAVGDVSFREQCLRKMEAVIAEGRTVLLVSHDMETVNALCGRTLQIKHGILVSATAGAHPSGDARRTGAGVALEPARAARHGAGTCR
jgi:ABC-type Na+ transport system ATPase subunit NatA